MRRGVEEAAEGAVDLGRGTVHEPVERGQELVQRLDLGRGPADLVDEHGFTDFEFENENIRVRLSKAVTVAAPVQQYAAAPIAPTTQAPAVSTADAEPADDGLHKIVSPKAQISKVYEATLAQDLRGDEAALFASGTLQLESENTPLAPAQLAVVSPRLARLTLTEGRYHQVRRMFAAVGNHVQALHRSRIGGLELGGLASGEWRMLAAGDLERLFGC